MPRPGIRILSDTPGTGAEVERKHVYQVRLNLWLNQGEPVRWDRPWGLIDRARLEDEGATLITDLRIDRENLFAGLFQGIEGMRIGGRRKLKISPHLAYGEQGIPGKIPAQAVIIAEIEFIEEWKRVNRHD
ncbi:MAG: FKBP-type peptidyl-prolyl cis-trans isomerase [Gammaproteobacteria bacterium]